VLEPERFVDAVRRFEAGGTRIAEWSMFLGERRGLSLGIKDREAGNAHAPLTLVDGLSARYRFIWSDGRVSRGALERRQLDWEPARALEQARRAAYDDPDAAQVLGPTAVPDIPLHHPAAAAVAAGGVEPLVSRLASIRRRFEQERFRTWSGSFSAAEAHVRLVTSAGLDLESRATAFAWQVSFQGKIGDGFGSRTLEPDAEFEARLDRLSGLVRCLETPGPAMAGGSLPVLLHPAVVEQFVLATLLHNLNGATVAHEEGHFRREDFGSPHPVLREDLSLRLDPLEPFKRGSYRFTTEGVPAARCDYVRDGRLVQPILDLKYARRLGLAPTPLPHATDTLHLEGPARLPLAKGLSRAQGGILVLSVLGAHTQDAASGDFSLSAPHSLRIGPGGYEGAVRCTIAGNLFAVLRSDALELVEFEGHVAPGLLFPCRVDPK
jgi:PmbA protein